MEEEIKRNLLKREENLSPYACKSTSVIRLREEDTDNRPPFFRDVDRIIYSLAYSRYIDKTQVFSYLNNDHISKRMIHVQFVSKIARTIARMLNLNEDLVEAASLGHDIGHAPLGHLGEKFLDEISKRELNQNFMHNIQSVRNFLVLDNDGRGKNVSLQVLDAIMCHNGEILENIYKPQPKTKEEFFLEYETSYYDAEKAKKYRPMTLEGCVVRISDIIAYLGRDIEDAIMIGILKRSDLPKDVVQILGDDNSKIITNIIDDIVKNSYGKPYIKMSDEVFKAMFKLKEFNYQNIYNKAYDEEKITYYRDGFNMLYKKYLNDLETDNEESSIIKIYTSTMDQKYLNSNNYKRIVIDYLAGMTDDYFLMEYKKLLEEVK